MQVSVFVNVSVCVCVRERERERERRTDRETNRQERSWVCEQEKEIVHTPNAPRASRDIVNSSLSLSRVSSKVPSPGVTICNAMTCYERMLCERLCGIVTTCASPSQTFFVATSTISMPHHEPHHITGSLPSTERACFRLSLCITSTHTHTHTHTHTPADRLAGWQRLCHGLQLE